MAEEVYVMLFVIGPVKITGTLEIDARKRVHDKHTHKHGEQVQSRKAFFQRSTIFHESANSVPPATSIAVFSSVQVALLCGTASGFI